MSRTLPVQKNDIIDIVFEDLTHDGSGVAKVEGYPLFIPNGLPGEKAKVKVIKTNKNYGFGRMLELEEKALTEWKHHVLFIKNAAAASFSILIMKASL